MWLATELLGGSFALLAVAALNGWSLREQIVVATAVLLVGAAVAAPVGRRPALAFAWIPLLLVLLTKLDAASAGVVCGMIAAAVVAGALVARPPLELVRAAILLATLAIASGTIPFDAFSIATIVTLLASLTLLWSISEAKGVEPAAVSGVMLLSAVALPMPFEVTLFPAILAAAIIAGRSGSALWCVLAGLVALLGGKWMVLPVVLMSLAVLLRDHKVSRDRADVQPLVAIPALAGRSLASWFLVAVAAWPQWLNARMAGVCGATVLLIAAMLIDRPWIALVWVLSSILILLVTQRENVSPASRIVLPSVAAVVAGGIAWSGAMPSIFPLPASWFGAGAVVLAISLLPLRAAVTAPAAAILVVAMAGWLSLHASPQDATEIEKVLRAGESHIVDPAGARNMEIVLRGGNITRVASSTPVVIVESAGGGVAQRRVLSAKQLGDWGSLRPSTYFSTRSGGGGRVGPLMNQGREAFFRYSRSVKIDEPAGVDFVRIVAEPSLPQDVIIVVESVRTWTP